MEAARFEPLRLNITRTDLFKMNKKSVKGRGLKTRGLARREGHLFPQGLLCLPLRHRVSVGRRRVAVIVTEAIGVAARGEEELRLTSHRRKLSLRAERAFEALKVGGRLTTFAQVWRRDSWAYTVIREGLTGSG